MSSSSDQSLVSSTLLDSAIPILWRAGTVVAGLVAVVAGLLYAKQDSLLYFPGECVFSVIGLIDLACLLQPDLLVY